MKKLEKYKLNKYVLYAICFWLFIGPLIYKISKLGLATFGGWDAITQTYQVMLYTSRLVKEFISALLGDGSFTFPMIEWNLGMGDDVIVALNWYGFGDPFYLLTAFIEEEHLPYFFSWLFYFRVFLGGIAFIAYAHELNKEHSNLAYVVGGLLYSFTGFTIQCNMHMIFVHAMMYIPLLLLGAERAMQNKKKGILCLTVFLFALSGFYYLYIGSITLAVYVIYRYVRRCIRLETWNFKEIFSKIGMMIAEYMVGIALSAVIFLPAVIGFLASNRASVKADVSLFMPWREIKSFWINFFLPQYDNFQVLSICTIGVMCILFILFSRKKKIEKVNVALLFLCSFIPMVSVVMSGFGECYDRWEVVITMYFAFLAIEVWDDLYELSWVQRLAVIFVFLVLGILGKKLDILEHERFRITFLSYGVLLFAILIILPICKKMDKRKFGNFILFVIAVITIWKDWGAIARDREIAYVRERDVVSELIDEQEGFYRIDNERTWSEPKNGQNIALTLGYHGISEYISIENPSFTNALVEWNVSPDAYLTHMNIGLDTRGPLETLCSVKYLIKREDTKTTIPYGFKKIKVTTDGQWSLYENRYALPLIYTYDKVFEENLYQEMSGFERQQVMLQAASAEGYKGILENAEVLDNDLTELKYTISDIENGELDGDILRLDAGAKISFETQLKTEGENYLLFEGVDFDNNLSISIEDQISKGLVLTSDYHNGNIGVNLGNTSGKITISFQNPETFALSQMKILHYDFSNYEKHINILREESMTNLSVETNQIVCNMNLDKNKMLCVAVPYSKGWKAYVDGKKTQTYRVNDMFIGIEVSEGEHDIELKYVTPGLKIGIVISSFALSVILVYDGVRWCKRRKNSR